MNKAAFELYVARKFCSKAQNAKDRGLEFTITLTSMRNILKAKKCFYTGLPLTLPDPAMDGRLRPTDLTIDRIDATKGYVPGNVVACCHAANSLKERAEGAGVEGLKLAQKILGKAINRIEKESKNVQKL